MCLDVVKSHVRKPIPEMFCIKLLTYDGNGTWITPYRQAIVPVDTGWFMPTGPAKRQSREYRKYETIEGGYIHAYISQPVAGWRRADRVKVLTTLPSKPKKNVTYTFQAIARDVVALGDVYEGDLVCKAIYIPAFDKTGDHRHAMLDMNR